MGKRFFVFGAILTVFMGCQDITSIEKPENLISEKEMEEIMYETVLLKSARGSNLGNLVSTGIDPETHVLEKFDIDSAQYADNTVYYTSQLEQYTAMNARIKERVLSTLKIEDSLYKIEKKIEDSLRLKRNRENEEKRMAKRKKDSLLAVQEGTPIPALTSQKNNIIVKEQH